MKLDWFSVFTAFFFLNNCCMIADTNPINLPSLPKETNGTEWNEKRVTTSNTDCTTTETKTVYYGKEGSKRESNNSTETSEYKITVTKSICTTPERPHITTTTEIIKNCTTTISTVPLQEKDGNLNQVRTPKSFTKNETTTCDPSDVSESPNSTSAQTDISMTGEDTKRTCTKEITSKHVKVTEERSGTFAKVERNRKCTSIIARTTSTQKMTTDALNRDKLMSGTSGPEALTTSTKYGSLAVPQPSNPEDQNASTDESSMTTITDLPQTSDKEDPKTTATESSTTSTKAFSERPDTKYPHSTIIKASTSSPTELLQTSNTKDTQTYEDSLASSKLPSMNSTIKDSQSSKAETPQTSTMHTPLSPVEGEEATATTKTANNRAKAANIPAPANNNHDTSNDYLLHKLVFSLCLCLAAALVLSVILWACTKWSRRGSHNIRNHPFLNEP